MAISSPYISLHSLLYIIIKEWKQRAQIPFGQSPITNGPIILRLHVPLKELVIGDWPMKKMGNGQWKLANGKFFSDFMHLKKNFPFAIYQRPFTISKMGNRQSPITNGPIILRLHASLKELVIGDWPMVSCYLKIRALA
jgi:hypothetical protein